MTRPKQWTSQEATRAAQLFQRHFTDHFDDFETDADADKKRVFALIARDLGRDHGNIVGRYGHYGPSFSGIRTRRDEATHVHYGALQEMQRRERAKASRSITAAIFGDPPPGYSALDRKSQGLEA